MVAVALQLPAGEALHGQLPLPPSISDDDARTRPTMAMASSSALALDRGSAAAPLPALVSHKSELAPPPGRRIHRRSRTYGCGVELPSSSPSSMRRKVRPRAFATATAAAVALTYQPLSAEAAYSALAFTTPTLPMARMDAPHSTSPAFQCTESTAEKAPSKKYPLHHHARVRSSLMSKDDFLADATKIKQSRLVAFHRGGVSIGANNPLRLGSFSGQYGGLGSGESSSRLSVSQSTNTLGFQVEDFEPYDPNNKRNNNGEKDERLRFAFEGFDENESLEKGTGRPVIRTQNPRLASRTSQRVAASLLKHGSTTRLGRDLASVPLASSSRKARPANKPKLKSHLIGEEEGLPVSFPWVPTESEINSLRVVELRAACAERGLIMTGKKAELQQRLMIWSTVQDRKRVKDRLTGLRELIQRSKSKRDVAENYDVDALTNKRKALTKVKKRGRKDINNNRGILGLVDETYFNGTATEILEVEEDEDEEEQEYEGMVDEASISRLSKAFNSPSSNFSNRDVREMYIEAKVADQAGNRKRSKAILSQLRVATPYDMRVVRRLARMEQEDGNLRGARILLQEALEMNPNNVHLFHGLGQLERSAGNNAAAKKFYREASKLDPSFPNSYHALGTLEHTHGNIRAALTVIKEGLRNCPKNHRLYHALGDVYLDANLLDLAEESYLAGLPHTPRWGKAFFYSSLSYVSYARGRTRDCRTLLGQSLEVNGGMHAQGVIALAQLEESEGDVQSARKVYRDAISRYEQQRRRRSPIRSKTLEVEDVFDTSSLVDAQGNQYGRSYAGDKWINVFKSWARMEEVHGTYETAHIVFSKAARMFPNNISLLIQWARLQADHGDAEKAGLLYEAACHKIGGRSAEPYRLFAEFEMRRKNFVKAQSVLVRGAKAVAESLSDESNEAEGSDGNSRLAGLFHTWGVCGFHLGSQLRSEQLFEDALRVTGSGEGDSAMRSLVLYSMARLEFARGENLLAQHCIGLSMKENLLPGGNSLIWKLWSEIAEKMENDQLVRRCKEQALLRWEEERGGTASDLSRLLGERGAQASDGRLPERTGSVMKDMFRNTPWHSKVCPPSGRMDKDWYSGAKLWEL
ncbi:hypothetical protein ACHAWF_005808 [Thalassiosira exigua]